MVAAIGITSAANAAIELYKPDGRLAEHAAMTGVRVGEALESFIKELNGSH